MLEKAIDLCPDEVIIDLEDAVPADQKTSQTRSRVVDVVRDGRWRAKTIAVRVNGTGTRWFADDMNELLSGAGSAIDCFVLPKVEAMSDVRAAADLLEAHGSPAGLEAQIESARGLIEVERIAESSPRLEALVFGPGDYAASLTIPHVDIGAIDSAYPGDQWHYPRSRIAVAAHANGLDAIDGPYSLYRDEDGLRESARRARLLGFTGKWVIHPAQIAICAAAFTPSDEELVRAEAILSTIALANERGDGAASVDGVMVDEASRRMAEAIVARRS